MRERMTERSELAAEVTHQGGRYQVLVGWGLLDDLGRRVADEGLKGPAYIVSDDRVFSPYGRLAQRSLEKAGIPTHCFIIPAGESSKTLEVAQGIYQWLVEMRAERRHPIVAVGGGVVGDLAGFVAATFLRGMPFVQVPTSMAAMVDASIGGKVAVDLPQGKNLVGSFYQPRLVLADVAALATLGKRELAEGWAEAIKHGLILDADLFAVFEEHAEDLMDLEPELSTDVIRRSVAIKARVVSEDEKETLGRRILLNYGHTIGHAIEAATGYGRYLHGEGVSVGMTGASIIGRELGLTDQGLVDRQRRVLERFGLPTGARDVEPDDLFRAMLLDKKTESGSIRWVMLEDVGRAVVTRDVPGELVERTVRGLLGP
ncbi:MAG: 3-dehydroquinate synthase [Dehalococcoidia bacterium]|nr:3-dehydroquinate synthase [Dehalococcoidia bacterium]